MSALFYPFRNHHRSYGNRHHVAPSYTASPWNSSALYRDNDPYSLAFSFDQPFHQPFLSLFNDTFSQLDRLSNELNGRINDNDSDFGKILTLAPKFDIKETDKEFILEGELPGVEKKDISLDFVDDNTLVLKARTEKVREEGAKPQSQDQSQAQGKIEGEKQAQDVQMSGANQEAAQANGAQAQDKANDTTLTTTNQNKEVAKPAPATQYHITERSIGTFQRVFSLPGEINHEGVKAGLKNGILTVTVPKVVKEAKEEKKKSRSVTVEEVPADEESEKAKS